MAQGYCYIKIWTTLTDGDFTATGGDTWSLVTSISEQVKSGSAEFQCGGDDSFHLFDDSDIYLGEFTAATLPEGFQFTEEVPPHGDGSNCYFTMGECLEIQSLPTNLISGNAQSFITYFGVDNLPPSPNVACSGWSTSFGWNNGSHGSINTTVRQAFMDGFTAEGSFTATYEGNLGSFYGAAATRTPTVPLPSGGFPGYFVVGWSDNPSGPPLGPVTGPILNTTTPAVTVIPPANTTIITVTTPTTTITTNATPATPVTVVLPPGTTVVTITPTNPGVNPPGPSLIIPINLDVESVGLVIDMAVASDIMLIGNPSGIYTLIPNQRFDVLYERAAGTTTTQTVQIPRPYGITSYVPEAD